MKKSLMKNILYLPSTDDFFSSAMQSAKEIDENKKVTHKHTIWMQTQDLLNILKPNRTKLLKYLQDKENVYYSVLLEELHKSPSSLNSDLELLKKYQLIDIQKEVNSGHGIRKVVKSLFINEELEFRAKVS